MSQEESMRGFLLGSPHGYNPSLGFAGNGLGKSKGPESGGCVEDVMSRGGGGRTRQTGWGPLKRATASQTASGHNQVLQKTSSTLKQRTDMI